MIELEKETQGRFYRPELDVIRSLAFFLVFVHHAIPSSFKSLKAFADIGASGMSLFFVLSSFLITELLRLEKERSGRIRLDLFYLRRVLRIWPLYFAFIALAVVYGLYLPYAHVPARAVLAMVLLAANWFAAAHGFFPGPAGPLWSISLEEQFYLVWPLLCRWATSAVLTCFSLVVVFLGAFMAYHLAAAGAERSPTIWVNTLVEFQMFGLGALLALWLRGRIPRMRSFLRTLLIAAGVLFYAVAELKCKMVGTGAVSPATLAVGYLLSGVASCFMICGFLGASLPNRMQPLVYLGKISYGLYVFHLLCLQVMNQMFSHSGNLEMACWKFVGSLAATIGLTALSYRFLERPFVRLKERFAVVRSRVA